MFILWIINFYLMDSLNHSFKFHCSNLSCGLYCFLSPTVLGFALFLIFFSKTLSYFIRLFGLPLSSAFSTPSTSTEIPRAINFLLRIALDISKDLWFLHLISRVLKSFHSFPQWLHWPFKNVIFTHKYLCSFYLFCYHCFPVWLHYDVKNTRN